MSIKSVKSAVRVLRIFELLAQYPKGITIKEISEKLSFPQSSTSNLIGTLFKEGYLIQDPLRRYRLGPKMVQMGTIAMESLDISKQGTPYLNKLMEEVQETVFMSVLSGGELVYVAKIDSNRSVRTTAQPGYRKPLYCTGLGKAFLAFLPDIEKNMLLDQIKLIPITNNTITDRNKLEAELNRYREMGYSIDDEENEEGLYCLAAPIFGPGNTVLAAISVAGPKERMINQKHFIVEKLLKTSRKISESIGHYQDL